MSLLSRWFGGGVPTGPDAGRVDAWRQRPEADLALPHARTRYVVVDVETTGLDLRHDALIAIGAVGVGGNVLRVADAWSAVLRQRAASANANILIHQIGGEAQLDGADPAAAMADFLEFAGKDPLVAFRAEFDRPMLERGARAILGIDLRRRWVDLAFLLPALFPGRDCDSLDDWLAEFAIDAGERHDALADAAATAELLLIALAAADRVAMRGPGDLLAMQKAQRWLGTRR